ncbi:hypothetical protein [Pelagibaculum spongiae]|uniref:Uncharacterized protein n=1 Tax=Pelagibaculum spongiae TaxID=2080658 RepID=A0A2V1GNK2_9GAMM|nr:hypothetical protein [Pelagibaculum spongiae]PVZ63423.1 hypothetical protein DC094_21175 [Pelagibaculum spongiae]
MRSNWKTQKGDEWSYEDGSIKSVADFDSHTQIFTIRDLSGDPSKRKLLAFIKLTQSGFTDAALELKVSRFSQGTKKQLGLLQSGGIIELAAKESDSGAVKINYVKQKKW